MKARCSEVCLVALAVSVGGCVSRSFNPARTFDRTADVPPPPACDQGDSYAGFIIEKAAGLDTALVSFPGSEGARFVEPSYRFQVRLDTCVGSTVKYKQLVLVRPPRFASVFYPAFTPSVENHAEGELVLPLEKFEVRGLDEALFSQEWSKLEMDVRTNWYEGFVLKGWGRGDAGFVTFHNLHWDTRKKALVPLEGDLLAGKLVNGNIVSPNQKCAQGTYKESRVTLGTARLNFELCYEYGSSATEYKVLRLKITDSNPALRPEEREVEITRPEDLVRVPEGEVENDDFYGASYSENRLYFDINHHNACDTFYLNLRHAQFSGTSSVVGGTGGGWDGCAPGVVTAPRYRRNAEGLLWTVKYKATGQWQDVQEHPKVGHFFSDENEAR